MSIFRNERLPVLGFSGTRHGMTQIQAEALRWRLAQLRPRFEIFAHGDCVGSDEEAHAMALALGYRVWIFPPKDASLRAYCQGAIYVWYAHPYLKRNRDIASKSLALIGCPHYAPRFDEHGGWVRTGGTYYTLEYARARGVPVMAIYHDGSVETRGEP